MKKISIIIIIVVVLLVAGGLFILGSQDDNELEVSNQTVESSVSATVNESVVTATAEPIVAPTVEPTTEPTVESSVEAKDETQSTSDSNANSGSYNPTIEATTKEYCTFTEIETKTMYTLKEGSLYGDPNAFEGALVTQGGYEKGTAYEITAKTTINGVEYYAFTNAVGTTFLIPAKSLSETAPSVETETEAPSTQTEQTKPSNQQERPVVNDKYEVGSMASTLTDEQVAQVEAAYRDMGYSEAEINEILYGVAEDIAAGKDTTGYVTEDEMTDVSDIPEDVLQKLQGMTTH